MVALNHPEFLLFQGTLEKLNVISKIVDSVLQGLNGIQASMIKTVTINGRFLLVFVGFQPCY